MIDSSTTGVSGAYAATLSNVSKAYRLDEVGVPALRNVSLQIPANALTVITGVSGSGKTTLLNLIGCIDMADAGTVHVDGRDVARMSDDELSEFRLEQLGFVFQSFNLLPVLTAFENVKYPLVLAGQPPERRRTTVLELLDAVGLANHVAHRPGELSGGQRQRVAIARALAVSPRIVLADEPTANLDSVTGAEIVALMRRMQRELAVTFIFSSHDAHVTAAADHVFRLSDGCITTS